MSRQGGNRWLSVGRTREKCGVMVLPGVAAGEAAVKPGSAVPIHSHSCGKRNGIFHLFFLLIFIVITKKQNKVFNTRYLLEQQNRVLRASIEIKYNLNKFQICATT